MPYPVPSFQVTRHNQSPGDLILSSMFTGCNSEKSFFLGSKNDTWFSLLINFPSSYTDPPINTISLPSGVTDSFESRKSYLSFSSKATDFHFFPSFDSNTRIFPSSALDLGTCPAASRNVQ